MRALVLVALVGCAAKAPSPQVVADSASYAAELQLCVDLAKGDGGLAAYEACASRVDVKFGVKK